MNEFLSIVPGEVPVAELHGHLLSGVSPRPIAFVSSIDSHGQVNLSPYSFFNVFGANPPIAIFSPARRVRDNTIKHTLENAIETREVVINIVDYSMVQQVSLSSVEYPKGVNEFTKAGFTMLDSDLVRPPRVAESSFQLEAKVINVIETGQLGGAGNLVVCQILKLHIAKHILDDNNRINPFKLDAVARAGGNWYVRAQGDALFEVPKPAGPNGIGIDALPLYIRNHSALNGNHLGKLGNLESLPSPEQAAELAKSPSYLELLKETSHLSPIEVVYFLLDNNKTHEALVFLITNNYII